MDRDLEQTIEQATSAARTIFELAGHVAEDGLFPKATASEMATASASAAVDLSCFLSAHRHAFDRHAARVVEHAITDLEMLTNLASLVLRHEPSPQNVDRLAEAISFSAKRAMKNLGRLRPDLF